MSVDHMIWYKMSVIAESGLDDPWELYQKGDWTWDKFMEMSKQFADSENGKYAFDGYLHIISDAFLSTTGETFITLDDNGRYKNNCKNDKIYECMDYLRRFAPSVDGLRYPNERENGWSANGQKEIPYSISAINIIMKPNLVYIRKETSGAMMK